MIVIQNTASQTPSPSFQLHGACLETRRLLQRQYGEKVMLFVKLTSMYTSHSNTYCKVVTRASGLKYANQQ